MTPLAVHAAYIPEALRARNAWVVWKMEQRDGRGTKIPYNAVTHSTKAKSDDAKTWTDFSTALTAYSASERGFDGIGLMLAGGDVTCIDLDHCIVDGVIEPWAEQIIAKVDSYTETSQSGEGVHIFVIGTPPSGRRRKGVVEMYGPDDNRYIAVTGHRIDETGDTLTTLRTVDLAALHAELFPHEDTAKHTVDDTFRSTDELTDDEIYALVHRAANAGKFAMLAQGDWSAYGDDPSAARMALLGILAFYTQDEDQLVRMAETNGFDRPDDERKMRNHDIPNTLSTLRETYTKPIGRVGPISVRDNSQDEISGDEQRAETRVLDPISFPFDALPATLRTLAEHGGAASGCVPESVAVHGLSVLGTAIGDTAKIHIGSWTQRPIIWTAVVARPGTAKSTALNLAKAPLEKADAQAAQHERDMSSDSSKTVPSARRTLADDATAERLGMLLQSNPRGLLVAADELAGVITGLNQYKGGKGNDRQLYLKLWSGAALRVDRVSRDALYVAEPICAITGAVQPARVDLLSGDDGMTGRWLVAYLEDRGRTEPTDADLTFEAKAWAGTVNALLARQGSVDYSLDEAARDAFVSWRRAVIERTNVEQNPQTADYLGKLESHMARLMLLLHVADDPQTHETRIGVGTVARAKRLVDYFAKGATSHMTRRPDPTAAVWEQAIDAAAHRVNDWRRRHPAAKKRDLDRSGCAGDTAERRAKVYERYKELYSAYPWE